MHGILVIDKPVGPTSAEVVRRVKRRYREKIGHLGTLDPFASGVLPLCIGEATKIAQLLNAADKEYVGTLQLGRRTDTGDHTGNPLEEAPIPRELDQLLAQVPEKLAGRRLQIPPMYSAIKRGGVPLYKLARQGIVVERDPREVEIDFFALALIGRDQVEFHVRCSKGTYLRVLGEEIAAALGTVGHLVQLRRVRFGAFDLSRSVPLAWVEEGTKSAPVIPTREALRHLRAFPLPAPLEGRARQGSLDVLARLPLGEPGEKALLIGREDEVIALLSCGDRGWQYLRVFHETRKETTCA